MSGTEERWLRLFSGEPLDGSRLAREIADTVPHVNARVRMDEWRADLRRRVNDRILAERSTP